MGLAYSWSWAAVIVLFGLIPVLALMLLFRQLDNSPLKYFGQSDERRR
jgi:hypothetical protein